MIEISSIKESDVGRRVIWEVAPDVEECGLLAAWAGGVLVIMLPESGSNYMRPIEVDPAQVRWEDEEK